MKAHTLFPLYVVILNWNLSEETILCIESVRLNQLPGIEIVIVDNASTDRSVALLRGQLGDTVKLIQNGENLGFAGGVNVGIKAALAEGAQSVLLLNNDTIVASDMISCLVTEASQIPRAGIIGPVIYYYDHPECIWCLGAREYRYLPVPLELSARALYKVGSKPLQLDYGNACGMLVRRQVFEAIGLFDERYFIYFEDVDFCRRARQARYEVWCVPQAKMWHKVSRTMNKQKPGMRYTEWWGRARFYRTHAQGFSRGPTYAYLLTKVVKRTLSDLLPGDWELVKALWAGTFDGFFNKASRHFDFYSAYRPKPN